MATWNDIRNVLTNNNSFQAEMQNETLVKALLKTDNGRDHIVWIGLQDDELVLSAITCKLSEVNFEALFNSDILKNLKYGLSAVGEYLCVRHVALLEDMNATELIKPIVALAVFGDFLEMKIVGGDAY